ncbi:MAG: S8 family serine peptidase, partial [Alphaproteobacteria bacterium]
MESALWEYLDEGQPYDDVSVIVRLHPSRAIPSGLRVISRFGLVVTARLARRDITRIREEVASMKRPQDYSPALWQDDEADEADDTDLRPTDERRIDGLPTGKGVVLCHLDWGLDFTHPAFRQQDGRTRLLKLWDQGAAYDPAYPNRYGYGRIFSQSEINHALTQANPLAALKYRWFVSDGGSGAHGSHTMGISGGSPVTGLPTGLAPEADLLFVDLTSHRADGPQPLGSSTDLLEGVDFADRVAGNRPLVINASLGRQAGQHDGLTLTEQALDHFVGTRPGRVMAMSCGNYFNKQAHAHVTLQPGEQHSLTLNLAPGERKAEVDMWYPRSDL